MLPPRDQAKAREDHELHRQCRGGDKEAQATKRRRKQPMNRLVQAQLPWANTQQTQEQIHVIDLEEGNTQRTLDQQSRDPTLPTLEAPADEDSELDEPDNLAAEEGDPLVNMGWWDEISWDQIVEHTAVTMTNVPRGLTFSVGLWRHRAAKYILQQDTEEGNQGMRVVYGSRPALVG